MMSFLFILVFFKTNYVFQYTHTCLLRTSTV